MQVPLCVDLDGTLVRTDMLHETLLLLAKTRPASLASLPVWLRHGKAGFKHLVAERVQVDPAALPYRADVLELIETARAEGRPVILATAASASVAQAIADHLGVFDAVLSSAPGNNLSARAKAATLAERFGVGGFDYIGNDTVDLPVFAQARRAYLVSSRPGLRRAAQSHPDITFIDDRGGGVRAWAKALRVHQWLKNLLVFVPLVAAHRVGDLSLLTAAIIAFLSYSLCASSVYLLNDMLDLPADRVHHRKRRRPFASGALPVRAGAVAVPVLLACSVALALLLPGRFLAVLAFYYGLTAIYSFWLKKQVIVDVMLLAGLYTLRIIAGSAATDIRPSFWLLALSMFVFLGLAMVKRYSELRLAAASPQPLVGRGYHPDDLPVVMALGASSGMISVLILAMYTQADIVPENYPAPEWLWLAPALMLYWTARLWLKAVRGQVDDDPVVFAARDWQSLVVVGLIGIVFLLASSGWQPW
jgi:4-hydroxybenzoate polyprenyltransferase/phosphoserine phosphatase